MYRILQTKSQKLGFFYFYKIDVIKYERLETVAKKCLLYGALFHLGMKSKQTI